MGYRWHTGSIAWLIHRLTGILLTLYIFLHLYVLSNLRDPSRFSSMMDLMKNPLVRLGEAGLLALVIAHGLNGLRLILLDTGISSRYQKPLFWFLMMVGGFVFIAGILPLTGGL
jgi:succinate dehydrogenase / fumarate reductase cytochrome b subunit